MVFSNKFAASFSLGASALFGASVVLLYDRFGPGGAATRPSRLRLHDRAHRDSHTDTDSGQEPSQARGSAAWDVPVVLPPRVSRSARAEVTERFHQACVETAKLGLPSSSEVRCYGGYLASLNYERRLPNWVLERLPSSTTRSSASGGAAADQDVCDGSSPSSGSDGDVSRSRSQFFADTTVPLPFRVSADEYATRGLSRGHLAAARFHKGSQEEMDNTFNMNANMVPQDMTVNAVDWERLESLTGRLSREIARGSGAKMKKTHATATSSEQTATTVGQGALYVVSGPAFVPRAVHTVERSANGSEVQVLSASPPSQSVPHVVQYTLTGKKTPVAVPTHLFKVILAEKKHAGRRPTYEVAAFLMPNRAIPEEKPLTDYQVPVSTLENVTGLTFFPGLGVSAQSLPDLCASHQCNSRPAALFAKYRDVAQLRVATSVPELRQTYAQLQARNQEKGGTGTLDAMVEKEFHSRTAELVAESVRAAERG